MRIKFAILAAALCLSSAAQAVTTLTFDADTACGLTACADGSVISQDYGDTADFNVTYATRAGVGATALIDPFVRFWSTDYGDLQGIAYASVEEGVTEIRIEPLGQRGLSFTAFDIAGWFRTNRNTSVHLFDLQYNPLEAYDVVAPGVGHERNEFVSYNVANGFILQIGPDAFNSGIDNLVFDTLDAVPGVPEPSSWLMMILGFAFTGLAVRRSGRAAARA
ncbi:PEPxxWA-CTERM sorting domain-containing protein [Glacieibacterium frigidum]|nr:PEPxxWA-CTERM sorting domain-containing protein [Glacieibacterium frigidum]